MRRFCGQGGRYTIMTLLVLGSSQVGFAERARQPLTDGSTQSDVQKAWGEPDERIEREIKREVEWRYANGSTVTFREGQVVAWKSGVPALETSPPQETPSHVVAKKATERTQRSPGGRSRGDSGLDFIRELAKEIPSGPDASSPGGEVPASPQVDGVPPPPPPPVNQQLAQPPTGNFQMIDPRQRPPMGATMEMYPLDEMQD